MDLLAQICLSEREGQINSSVSTPSNAPEVHMPFKVSFYFCVVENISL